jgi:hypothetical protein
MGSTTAVGAEVAGPTLLTWLLAISWTSMVDPTSVAESVYVCPVAPTIGAQPAPPQRSHCKLKLVGLFVHPPCCSVNVWPSSGVPAIVGGEMFTGRANVVNRALDCAVEPA